MLHPLQTIRLAIGSIGHATLPQLIHARNLASSQDRLGGVPLRDLLGLLQELHLSLLIFKLLLSLTDFFSSKMRHDFFTYGFTLHGTRLLVQTRRPHES